MGLQFSNFARTFTFCSFVLSLSACMELVVDFRQNVSAHDIEELFDSNIENFLFEDMSIGTLLAQESLSFF